MLTARLTARCPSAVPIGTAVADDFGFIYGKIGMDGTAKATLVPEAGAESYGVLFRLKAHERPLLDAFEGLGRGYDRYDDFEVVASADGAHHKAFTYLAPPDFIDPARLPFDWYHALVLAGADEHGLPGHYVAGRIGRTRTTRPDNASAAAFHARQMIEKAQEMCR
jgi:gamma-glutamylcyclotransferase